MRILLSKLTSKRHITQLKEKFPDIDIDYLDVKVTHFFCSNIIKKILVRLLPYTIFIRVVKLIPRETRTVLVNDSPLADYKNNADILLLSYEFNSNPNPVIQQCSGLKWVHSLKTGVEHINYLKDKNVLLTNPGDISSKRVVEFVLSVILMYSKRILDHLEIQQQRNWQYLAAKDFDQLNIGIIGYGKIGKSLAKKCKYLGMKVSVLTQYQTNTDEVNSFYQRDNIAEFLKSLDFIVICNSLNVQTKHMIGRNEISHMNKNSILINVSRGEILNESEIINALKNKNIKGACLDVFQEEPLYKNSPFYQLNNVLITHHSSFFTEKVINERFDDFINKLTKYHAKENLDNLASHSVDFK